MAIIGPRPLLVRYLARYNEEQHHRHDVRPGLRKMKDEQCRNTLDRHKIDIDRIWTTKAPDEFKFAERNSGLVKKC